MPELEDRAALVYTATGARDFARKLDQALQEDSPERRRERRSFAAESTWDRRAGLVRGALQELFPAISILLVTHNSRDFIGPCLDSIARNTSYPNYEVLIADNASADGTAGILQSRVQADPRLRVTLHAKNLGFSPANNLLARQSAGPLLVFLNTDTIVSPGWLGRLRRPLLCDPRVGAVVAVTNWAGNEARINTYYSNLSEMEEFALRVAEHNLGLSLELASAPLFCALVPRAVWDEVGELDERFEIGLFEDDDFSLRLTGAGYRIVTAEDCFVHHFGGGSFSQLEPARYREIYERNQRRFESKWGERRVPHVHRAGIDPEPVSFYPRDFQSLERP
jgi:GT2 family glycosyltransferase